MDAARNNYYSCKASKMLKQFPTGIFLPSTKNTTFSHRMSENRSFANFCSSADSLKGSNITEVAWLMCLFKKIKNKFLAKKMENLKQR
jgi:hypothetical protein